MRHLLLDLLLMTLAYLILMLLLALMTPARADQLPPRPWSPWHEPAGLAAPARVQAGKPVEVMRWLAKCCPLDGTVLDPVRRQRLNPGRCSPVRPQ